MNNDVIILLANEMTQEGVLNTETTNRVNLACEYYQLNNVPIISCGWDYREDSPLFIGNVMKAFAVKQRVSEDMIFPELNSRDTVGDAFFSKVNFVNKNQWKNILVITSDYHVERTKIIFDFIYGDHYNIEVKGAESEITDSKLQAEQHSIKAFKSTFDLAIEGDDNSIFTALSTLHPFYNGEVYPKINSFL